MNQPLLALLLLGASSLSAYTVSHSSENGSNQAAEQAFARAFDVAHRSEQFSNFLELCAYAKVPSEDSVYAFTFLEYQGREIEKFVFTYPDHDEYQGNTHKPIFLRVEVHYQRKHPNETHEDGRPLHPIKILPLTFDGKRLLITD